MTNIAATSKRLLDLIDKDHAVDISRGVESELGVKTQELRKLVDKLVETKVAVVFFIPVKNAMGREVTMKLLVPPGWNYTKTIKSRDRVVSLHTKE